MSGYTTSMWKRTRLSAAAWLLVAVGSALAGTVVQLPADNDGVDTDGDGVVNNDNVGIHLTAGDGFINMADGRPMYIFGFKDVTGLSDGQSIMAGMLGAQFPGPTIKVREGQKLYLTLTNVGMMMRPDLFDPHSVHWHGFPNAAAIFDGVPDASIAINMMASLTYFYNVVQPGTYMYHCHVEATEHMQMGMLSNLYVLPRQDRLADGTDLGALFTHREGNKYAYNDGDGSTRYDVDYPIQLGSFDPLFHDASLGVQPLPFADMRDTYAMMNGRGYPQTVDIQPLANTVTGAFSQQMHSLITVAQGQRALLRLSNLSVTEYFTVSSPSIPLTVVGKGARLFRGPDGKDLGYQTTSVTMGGGESCDVILETQGIPAGRYFFYTTNMQFLSNDRQDFGGMMTEIEVVGPVGGPAAPSDGAVVPADVPPTLEFSFGLSELVNYRIQLSTSAGFSNQRETLLTRTLTETVYTLSIRDWNKALRWLEGRPPESRRLYWRAIASSVDGTITETSATRQLLVQPATAPAAAGRKGM